MVLPKKRLQRYLVTVCTSVFIIVGAVLCAHILLSKITVSTKSISYPPFVKAAQQGDISETERLLRSGAIVDQKTVGDQTALHIAAAEGQDQMVLWLLSQEADPLARDQNGNTPADFAKSQGHTKTAQIILDYIQLLKSEEQAIAAGDRKTLKKLLSEDVRRYTLLHILAQIGETQEIKNEINNGADVNATTMKGLTPLHKTVISEKVEVAQLLLDAGADVNARDVYNNTPLYYAILYNNRDIVKLFLKRGADVNIRSIFGNETAIDFAKRLGNPEIIVLLEQK